MKDDELRDPIVIDPPGFHQGAAWGVCAAAAENVGRPDGSVNWRAASSADPGVCTCPACHQYHWAWGRVHRCTACDFEYPTDWRSMYAWGVQAARQRPERRYEHAERMAHPYYRHGFENPVEDARDEHDRIDWRAATAKATGEGPPT